LLQEGGWQIKGRRTHGVALIKKASERTLVTIIPDTRESLPNGTLSKILGDQQSKLGKDGLLALLNKYGL
jgi:predicted RNA binding protein YcfA (HicA-like mRNA interferase family)